MPQLESGLNKKYINSAGAHLAWNAWSDLQEIDAADKIFEFQVHPWMYRTAARSMRLMCAMYCCTKCHVFCHGSGPYPQCEWVQNCSSWCFHRVYATSPHSSGQRAEPWLQFQVPAVRTMQQMHKEVAATTVVWYVDNILIMFGNWGSYHDPMLETLMAKFTRQRLHRNFGCQVQGRANAICTFLTTPVEPEPGEFAN